MDELLVQNLLIYYRIDDLPKKFIRYEANLGEDTSRLRDVLDLTPSRYCFVGFWWIFNYCLVDFGVDNYSGHTMRKQRSLRETESSKDRGVHRECAVDRLSNLPEGVALKILSLLTLRDLARFGSSSKTCRALYLSTPRLNFR